MAGKHGFSVAQALIAYKKYARLNFIKNPPTSQLWNFLAELSENEAINSFFNMYDFAQEFINLEDDYYALKNHIDFIPLYESIQRQVENPRQPIRNRDYWNLVNVAVACKILAIRNHTKVTSAPDMWTNRTEIKDKIEALNRDRAEYAKHVRDEHQQSFERRIEAIIEYTASNQRTMETTFDRAFQSNATNVTAQMIRQQLAAPMLIVQSFLTLAAIRDPHIIHLNSKQMVKTADTAYKMQQFSNIAKHIQRKLHPLKELLKDIGGILKEDKAPQLNELKRIVANLTVNVDELLASNRIESDIPASEWKNLVKMIADAKSHSELRKAQNLGNNIDGIIDSLIRIQNLVKCAALGIDAYRLCRNDSAKMTEFTDEIAKNHVHLTKCKEFEQQMYDIAVPWLKRIESSIGNSYLFVKKWHYSALKQLSRAFERMRLHPWPHGNDFTRLIDDTKHLIELTLALYNQIQVQSGRETIANAIQSAQLPIENAGTELQYRIDRLNESITMNLMLELCETTREALKTQAFPYDQHLATLCDFSMQNPKANNSLHIKQRLEHNLEHSIRKIQRANAKVHKQSGLPFYLWKSSEHKNEIVRLLSGEQAILYADITTAPDESPVRFNAIKFDRIWLNFTLANQVRQNDFDKALDGVFVQMNAIGNKYFYRCDRHIYYVPIDTISARSYQIKYVNVDDLKPNDSYGSAKLSNASVLSPYTVWQVQLIKPDASHGKLQEFYNDEIDLQLIGDANYAGTGDEHESKVCNNDELQKLYSQIDSPIAGESPKTEP